MEVSRKAVVSIERDKGIMIAYLWDKSRSIIIADMLLRCYRHLVMF